MSFQSARTPVLTHLLELRRRLLWCLLFFGCAFGISYLFVEEIYAYLMQPLEAAVDAPEQRRLIYTGLHEAFFTYLKLAFYTALFFTLPLALIQLWRFIAPGLYRNERSTFAPALALTPVLFLTGSALAFYGIIPLAWEFFLGFERLGEDGRMAVELEARVSEYLGLVVHLILAFGVCFQLPILLYVLARIGLVCAETLRAYRKHVVVLTFLVAAFITPPDLISQIALGVPVLLLYEITIIMIRYTGADRTAEMKRSTELAGT